MKEEKQLLQMMQQCNLNQDTIAGVMKLATEHQVVEQVIDFLQKPVK